MLSPRGCFCYPPRPVLAVPLKSFWLSSKGCCGWLSPGEGGATPAQIWERLAPTRQKTVASWAVCVEGEAGEEGGVGLVGGVVVCMCAGKRGRC